MDERSVSEGHEPGDRVGLGRVVENTTGLGETPASAELIEPDVDVSSDESFPASDPPAFSGQPVTPGDPARTERPDPPDGP
jgi:hypothetical protein